MKKINWPDKKDFAFAIIDDTDNGTTENVKPVYDLLYDLNLKATKTVWVYPPRDIFKGDSLQNENYLNFIKTLVKRGFEIALHGVGSGAFKREEIISGLKLYKKLLGEYPNIHVNHSKNKDNIYWGDSNYHSLLKWYAKIRGSSEIFHGENPNSEFFWGDFVRDHIKYTRWKATEEFNTLKFDSKFPYKVKSKPYSNYWFSSTYAADINDMNRILTKKNIDNLIKKGGVCILSTHFGFGYVKNGVVDKTFKDNLHFLSKNNGWFVNTSTLLDYMLNMKSRTHASYLHLFTLELKYVIDTLLKKIKQSK